MQRGLPDLIEGGPLGSRPEALLPTPTSGGGTGYLSGNHRDTWRPTLELAVQGYRPSKNGRPGRPETPALLPTPTARAYGSNQSLSAGAAVRPSLASLAARRLLPTPAVPDASGADTPLPPGASPAPSRRRRSAESRTEALLPTPLAADGRRQDHLMPAGNLTLLGAAALLPTPPHQRRTRPGPPRRGWGRSPDGGVAAAHTEGHGRDEGLPRAARVEG
jgi:hypothetical protein